MDKGRGTVITLHDKRSIPTGIQLLERCKTLEEAQAAALDSRDELYHLREDYTSLWRQLRTLREQHESMRVNVQQQVPVPLAADNEITPSPHM